MPSSEQRDRINAVILDHHLAFKVEVLGPASVPKADLDRLIASGIVKLPAHAAQGRSMVAVPAVHQLGALAAQTSEESVQKLSEKEFWEYIKTAPPKLTDTEREAINAVKDIIGDNITRLGQRHATAYESAAREQSARARRSSMLSNVKQTIATGIAERSSSEQIAIKLRKVTKDSSRDWKRVAQTELHNAFEEGKASVIAKEAGGDDPVVFKRPRPDACAYCKLLYLDKGVPRLFRLSQLISNGTTNEGRKAGRPTFKGVNATEYKAVIGAAHPWCQCSLHRMPPGFSFDKKGNMVYSKVKKALPPVSPNLLALIGHVCE